MERSYRDSLWLLAQFDRISAYVRGGAGLLVLLVVPVFPLAALYASVYVADTHEAQLAFGLLLIVATATSGWLWKRRLWEWPVTRRLEEWQSWDPSKPEVGVAIADADVRRASQALIRARLYPKFARRSNPLPDAPALDHYLAVVLPAVESEVEFEVVAERTRAALRRVGIRARVSGVDVPSI